MSNRSSYAQLEGLVEFLEQNPGIANCLLRTAQAKLETKRKWATLAASLNALGGANKDGQGWAKYWAEKKCALRKQCSQLSASMRRTGGGTADNLPALSALDNRLVAVMGGQEFATSDSRLTVNPFPESNIPIQSPVVIEENIMPILEDTEMHNIQISPVAGTSHDAIETTCTIPAAPAPQSTIRSRRSRSLIPRTLDMNMERFVRIEERRVEAELRTAQAFAKMSENIAQIANALLEIARKMPNP